MKLAFRILATVAVAFALFVFRAGAQSVAQIEAKISLVSQITSQIHSDRSEFHSEWQELWDRVSAGSSGPHQPSEISEGTARERHKLQLLQKFGGILSE